MPERFDENEWFLLAVDALMWALILLLPKRLSPATVIMIWVLNVALATFSDFLIGKKPVELYSYNDTSKYEWTDVLLYLFTYPPSCYFLLLIYDRFKSRFEHRLPLLFGYLVAWALLTTGLERLADQFHVFTYKGWKLAYSFPVYFAVYAINIGIYYLVRHSRLWRSGPGIGAEHLQGDRAE